MVSGGRWVNVVPLTCRAEVLVVTPSADAFDEIRARMLALTPIGRDIDLVSRRALRPLFAPSQGLALYEHARAIAGEIGFSPGHGSYGGGSDGNFTGALGVPTLNGPPATAPIPMRNICWFPRWCRGHACRPACSNALAKRRRKQAIFDKGARIWVNTTSTKTGGDNP